MNKTTILAVVAALMAGVIIGYLVSPSDLESTGAGGERKVLFYRNPMNPAITSPVPAQDEMGMDYIPVYAEEESPKGERKVLFYRNPMNPAITSPVPAQDEMGMDYIPVYADDEPAGDSLGTVKIDPTVVQNIGVRSAKVERRDLSRQVNAVGRIDYDEQRLTRLHPKVDGWVEKLFVQKTGETVDKDTILLSVYSPQLVATQQEYLLALRNFEALSNSPYKDIREGAREMVQAARERLVFLDVPEHQIRELEQGKAIKKSLHIHSPYRGAVMKVGAREGQFINPALELYTIADLSVVWVYVDVYEDDLPWVKLGDQAVMKVTALPGRTFTGKVSYVYPYLESKTRTVKVRLEFANAKGELKPEMFADVVLASSRQINTLVIPSEAVVRSGNREQVFVVRGGGKFEPREVQLGVSADAFVQVLSGLQEGDEVVTSAQFLIDSESKLREATGKMLDGGGAKPQDMSMDDMNMDELNMELMQEMDMGDIRLDQPAPAGNHTGHPAHN